MMLGSKRGHDDPVFSLPPYKVQQIYVALSEIVDWGLTLLNIPQLWRITGGEDVRVAVLDTGCALEHPDLKDAIVDAADFTQSRYGPADIEGHGTHCAGIIAARQNSQGVVGVAPQCQLLIGKVLGDGGTGTVSSIVSGIEWAIAKKADIISMSLGCSQSNDRLHEACKQAAREGIFVIAAAGNSGPDPDTICYPAKYPETLSVGAIDVDKKVARFSSRGSALDIVAPGKDIVSCYPPRNTAKLSGTSMACPFVAGVVALAVSKHRKYGGRTDLNTKNQLIEHLKKVAIDLGEAGKDDSYGYGLINPEQLLVFSAAEKEKPKVVLSMRDLTKRGRQKIVDAFGDKPVTITARLD